MPCFALVLLAVVFGLGKSQSLSNEEGVNEQLAFRLDGDLVLGGLFPVHYKGEDGSPCGVINPERGINRLEAMLFAVDEINNKESFFQPPLKLGVRIYDTCSNEKYAFDQSLGFMPGSLRKYLNFDLADCLDEEMLSSLPENVVGVIGASSSLVSIQVANILGLFEIPQISYASTSASLSDKTRFGYFARNVPSDTLQARAMADVVKAFNWSYVSTVASEGRYGQGGIEIFENEVKSQNVCIALSLTIPRSANDETFDGIISDLRTKPNVRTVILFLHKEDASHLLAATKRAQVETGHFVWVASDGWGAQSSVVKNHEVEAEGALTIVLHAKPIEKFDQYFLNLRPENNQRNPWFSEYWEQQFNCLLPNSTSGFAESLASPCNGIEDPSTVSYEQENKVPFVVDAVYSLAYAIQKIQKELCSNTEKNCENPPDISGSQLYSTLLNISFTNVGGDIVEFDSRGDGKGRYDIMNFQKSDGTYKYKKIGSWANQLALDSSDAVFGSKFSDLNPVGIPYSRCSIPCEKGEIKNVQEGDLCCWICSKCLSYQYLRDEFTCADCPEGSWPNRDLNGCYILSVQSIEWNSPGSIISIIIAGIGIAFTVATMGVFYKYKGTPVVKTSCQEMSFTLLVGILISYTMTFVLLAKPTVGVCTLVRLGLGLSFSICYASLLTKVNRISRIFNKLQYSIKPAKFINPRSQTLICVSIVGIQLAGEIIWLVLQPPSTKEVVPNRNNPLVILKCGVGEVEFISFLAYDLLLLIICTLYAFKARNMPESFNETKYIACSNYCTCIVWGAFLIIYSVIGENFKVKMITMAITVSLTASGILGWLFFPKIYIILFQPENNVTRLDHSTVYQKRKSTLSSLPSSTAAGYESTLRKHSN